MREIYFDHAATTKPYPEVLSVFDKVSRDDFAKFLTAYYDTKIYESDPFQHLDTNGVGKLVKMAAADGGDLHGPAESPDGPGAGRPPAHCDSHGAAGSKLLINRL